MSFEHKLESHGKEHVLFLSGTIDEHSDFSQIPIPIEGRLSIDLHKILSLNSVGLRTWVQWVAKLSHLAGIFLRNCPNPVVHQMNILDGFLPMGAIVESIYIPYYCESCAHETSVLIKRGEDFMEATSDTPARIQFAEEIPCEKCNEPAGADIIASKHFRFLQRRQA